MTKPLLALLIAVATAGAGCSMAALNQQGANVQMVQNLQRQDCQNLGPVFGKGGGAFGGTWVSDENLMEYATNDLRNRAAAKGATHVVFSTHQMGHSSGSNGGATSTATFTGVAYRCPPAGAPAAAAPAAAAAPPAAPGI